MTLTFPAINRARHVLWVVVGAGKRRALAQLLNADPSIPASRISDDATIIADAAAVTSGSH